MNEDCKKCPKCGGTDIGYGKQGGYAEISPNGKMGFGSSIRYVICTDCGYVIESYVKNQSALRGRINTNFHKT